MFTISVNKDNSSLKCHKGSFNASLRLHTDHDTNELFNCMRSQNFHVSTCVGKRLAELVLTTDNHMLIVKKRNILNISMQQVAADSSINQLNILGRMDSFGWPFGQNYFEFKEYQAPRL